jgi:RraA family protein
LHAAWCENPRWLKNLQLEEKPVKPLINLGLRINMDYQRVDAKLVKRARDLPVAVVGDVANRLQAFAAGYVQYGRIKKFAGPALTVRVRPGDNLLLHKALDLAQPGDVIVVDAGGAPHTAIIGAMMSNYAKTRGVEAMIIDGAIRDVEELAALDFAVVARGATPNGPFKTGPGEIGYAIACGGLSIAPGDLLLGDMDGVLVLPREEVATILGLADEKFRLERAWEIDIAAGKWDRAWVDEALRKL